MERPTSTAATPEKPQELLSSRIRSARSEQTLARQACDIESPGSELGFAFNALRTDSSGRGLSIILERLDVSPRTLRRRCQDAFGYGPKTLERILRFQRFLHLARRAQQPKLAALAFEAGYSDQAHLTREVRSLSGFSPGCSPLPSTISGMVGHDRSRILVASRAPGISDRCTYNFGQVDSFQPQRGTLSAAVVRRIGEQLGGNIDDTVAP